MTFHLVATRPFLGYVRGDIINDVAKVNEILASDYRRFVVKVASSAARVCGA
jgi:hypothetical protein